MTSWIRQLARYRIRTISRWAIQRFCFQSKDTHAYIFDQNCEISHYKHWKLKSDNQSASERRARRDRYGTIKIKAQRSNMHEFCIQYRTLLLPHAKWTVVKSQDSSARYARWWSALGVTHRSCRAYTYTFRARRVWKWEKESKGNMRSARADDDRCCEVFV